MARNPSSGPANSPGAIPFEIADLADARRALDELPPGVGDLVRSAAEYWKRYRRAPRPEDRALTGSTIDWLLALPPEHRPLVLCERYPRVANLVAAAWPRLDEREAVLKSLLVDARGSRKGFPTKVRREIEALYSAIHP